MQQPEQWKDLHQHLSNILATESAVTFILTEKVIVISQLSVDSWIPSTVDWFREPEYRLLPRFRVPIDTWNRAFSERMRGNGPPYQ